MTQRTTLDRADAHNPSVNLELAQAGYCGMTHLCSGRVCVLAAHHLGSCRFATREEAIAQVGVDPDSRAAPENRAL